MNYEVKPVISIDFGYSYTLMSLDILCQVFKTSKLDRLMENKSTHNNFLISAEVNINSNKSILVISVIQNKKSETRHFDGVGGSNVKKIFSRLAQRY